MELGTRVLFNVGDSKAHFDIGMIIDHKDNKEVVLKFSYGSVYVNLIDSYKIINISEVKNARQEIVDYYTQKIEELRSKLKKVTSEEKIQERTDKYNRAKELIIKNCQRVAICTDDDEFENRLKEINKLKKELHSIDLECGDIIRKENGTIKYKIRQVEQQMNGALNAISDESIAKAFEYR